MHFHLIYCLLSLLNPKLFYTLGVVILLLFISIYADPETIADELNPLTISHTAKTISCTAIGSEKIEISDVRLKPNIPNKPSANNNMAPIRPQTEINRGTSFDLYNK